MISETFQRQRSKSVSMQMGETLWHSPATLMSLSKDEVHVWRAPLDLEEKSLKTLQRALSLDECERAQRFYFDRDRRRFISSRALIRDILRRYLQAEAEELQFRYNVNGKPFLKSGLKGNGLDFNLSHSEELALFAVARGRRIGIDLEFLSRDQSLVKDIETVLSPNEIAMLTSMPENDRLEALLLVWTCKEAYLKGLGTGLLAPLTCISVLAIPGEPVWIKIDVDSLYDGGDWRIKRLDVGNDFVGALAVEGPSADLKFWQWKPI